MGRRGAAVRGQCSHLAHRIDQLTAQQEQRRLAVDLRVVERVGDDFRQPHQAGLHILQEKQLHGAEQQRTDADDQPDFTHMPYELGTRGVRRKNAEAARIEPQHQRRHYPHQVQNHLATQVVADFDAFLVLVGRLVDGIVALRLEEKMPRLAAHHGHQPADQRRFHRVEEHGDVGSDEADGAQEVQRLVDAAVVVETVIVPSLGSQFCQKTLHGGSFGIAS